MTAFLLHHLLAQGVAQGPDRPAVLGRDATLTYGELNRMSDRLASALRRAGVVTGDRIGIDLEKSPEAVVAIYGILKAGAAYVPIDPKAPAGRAAYIVGNCGMRGLITTAQKLERLRPALAAVPDCIVLVNDAGPGSAVPWEEVRSGADAAAPDTGTIEQDLAYILYTSGSTGEPKGVMLSHRAALSFVNWAVDYFQLRPEDRLSNHAPLHFDLSIFDLFAAAAVGASVAMVPPGAAVFPRNLADWVEKTQISVWYSVPSALAQLALNGGLDRHAFANLRLVLFAGEVFPVRPLRSLMQQLPGASYFNLYGPTETNVCTVYPVAAVPEENAEPLPIGRACADTMVFALDDNGNVVRTGGSGELYVRGPTLMHGYWGRPDLTDKVMPANPHQQAWPERVYRTGDLVRLGENGDFYFIGRRDLQVKSRGYRIELGDVEAVLHRHPGVAEAVVIAVPHEEFGCTLKGVVAVRAETSLKRGELAAYCAEYLPPYMVPSDYQFLDNLPKTSNGKVDRRALQAGG